MDILSFEPTFSLGIQLQFVYLVMMIPLLLIWMFLYYKYPRYRKSFLITFVVIGTVGHFSQFMMYRHDWFNVLSFMGNEYTFIEDMILAGTNAGLVLITWPLLTGQNFKEKQPLNKNTITQLIIFWLIMSVVPYALFLNGTHSFIVEMVVYGIFILTIFMKHKDMIIKSIASSLIITSATIPFYIAIQFLTTNFAQVHYRWSYMQGTTFLNIPIEDYLWYFLVNILQFVFYHYIFESVFDTSKITWKTTKASIKNLFSLRKIT